MGKAVGREELAGAVGKVLFLKLSAQDKQKLFEKLGDPVDWPAVAQFSRQAVRAPEAARTLSSHYARHLATLNAALEPQMYLGGAQPVIADLACYLALVAIFTAFDDMHKWALCSASRWFDHMQHRFAALLPPPELIPSGPSVPFDRDPPETLPQLCALAPIYQLGGDAAPTGGASGETAGDEAAGDCAAAGGAGKPMSNRKEKKKEKIESKPPKEPKAAVAVNAAPAQSDISKLDIRVGHILSAERHPEADKLYVEKVDVGDAAPRTVVSGLVDYMPADALAGKRAVLLCNLKPAKMKGIESQAMVLAASDDGKTKVELLVPPDAAPVGERIHFEGHAGEPLPPNQISKKKVWEAVQPELGTSAERVATYAGLPFLTTSGPCTVATITGGTIK